MNKAEVKMDISCAELLALFREYENQQKPFVRIPYLRLFCDGSGAVFVGDVEVFEFYDIGQLVEKLKEALSKSTARAKEGM